MDAFVLDLLRTRTFSKDDFAETRQGVCRVLPPLTHFLAETTPRWAQAVAPAVERVAQALTAKERERRSPISTPLTQNNRSAGRDRVRKHPRRKPEFHATKMPQACRKCGVVLNGLERRLYCDECLPGRQLEQIASYGAAGRQSLARLREEGRDPAHGEQAARKRGRRIADFNRAAAKWMRNGHSLQNERGFRRDILSRLRNVPLQEMARVTGFSLGYCSFIRRGLRVPHPRHWDSLMSIVGGEV